MTEAAPFEASPEREALIAAGLSRNMEAVFRKIEQERMQDVPILNHALSVACVGMRRSGGCWLSVLVTPWFINLMLLPGNEAEAGAWNNIAPCSKVMRQFPSGLFEFIRGGEEGIGPYQMCSLFSPVLQFDNQEAALAAAGAALAALFDASLHPDRPGGAQQEGQAEKVSRRDLFAGFLRERGGRPS